MNLEQILNTHGRPVILSLYDFSGNWSKPYRDAGYEVHQIDISLDGTDVRLYDPPFRSCRGILAAPPCTCFASCGARWSRSDSEMIDALSMVDATLRLVHLLRPKWWVLENPTGTLVRYLGQPAHIFNPYDYGDPWAKRTCLWGRFTIPTKTPVSWTQAESDARHNNARATDTVTRSQARAITPLGFANAFYKANP